MDLISRIRKAREIRIEAGGVKFIARRPTDLDMMEMRGQIDARKLIPFVVGWEGVTEGHLLNGGDPHPLPFDAGACAEWLADRPDLLSTICEQLIAAYAEHAQALEAARKN